MTDSRTTPAHLQAVLDAAKIAHDAEEPHGGASNLDHVVFPFAFDTPGIVIPASGPAGIKVTDLNPGDVLLGSAANAHWLSFVSVTTAFNGTTPYLVLTTTPLRGDLPDTLADSLVGVQLNYADQSEDGGTTVWPNTGIESSRSPLVCRTPTSLWAWLVDGFNNDPGCTEGEGELHLFIARA